MLEVIGYIAAIGIGLTLGLIGGGGSILTVPVLVYLFGLPPVTATSYSLFVVGISSFSGLWPRIRRREFDLSSVLFFGGSSLITVFLIRTFVTPGIPEYIRLFGYVLKTGMLLMILFAVLMLMASMSMIGIRETAEEQTETAQRTQPWKLLLYGIGTGLITGMLGAGGGFLIIPVLTYFCHLPIRKAIGTSLCIITINALIGFGTDLFHRTPDWVFLLSITATAALGMFIGNSIGAKLSSRQLRKGFGWFVLVMAVYILFMEYGRS